MSAKSQLSMPYDSASQALAGLKAGAISAVDLLEAMIARITAIDPALNAVVVRDFDRARAAAAAADASRARGEQATRPLLGLPMTIKEAIDVEGLPTTWGQPGGSDGASNPATHADRDAVVVARLEAAGAILIGKTNVAMMLADWQSANPVYGVTRNPWNRSRTAGGSSGGAAAALAAGMTFLECGSDLAGSLRIPASFCGVCAHRPTQGIVPLRGFAPPGAPREEIAPDVDQSVLGPMARTAADLMLALDVIAGPDDADAVGYQLRLPPPRATTLDAFRVAIVDEHPLVPTSKAIRAAIATLATQLEQAGCKVQRQRTLPADALPDMRALSALFNDLLMAFFSADAPPQQGGSNDDARGMSHRDWIHADRRRFEYAARWRRLFEACDVVICPTASTVAFPHDDRPFAQRTLAIDAVDMPYQQLPLWCAWPTPTGQPVTTIPIARDADGLPIGIQMIGPRLEDRTPIMFATLLEHITR
jgi:amidase